jgi:hypothetical protein
VVQEALLRVDQALDAGEQIASPRAFVATVTTRLAINELLSARVRRERYVGEWLGDASRVERDSVGPRLDVGVRRERHRYPIAQHLAASRRVRLRVSGDRIRAQSARVSEYGKGRHNLFFTSSPSTVASTYPASAAPKQGKPVRIGCSVIASLPQIGTNGRYRSPDAAQCRSTRQR